VITIMRSVVEMIEERDHRVVVPERGEFMTDVVAERMSAGEPVWRRREQSDVSGFRWSAKQSKSAF
jgi:hypothetical protein